MKFSKSFKGAIRQQIGDNFIINPQIYQMVITAENTPGKLNQLVSKIHETGINMHNIESYFKNDDWNNFYLNVFYENITKQNQIQDFQKILKNMTLDVSELKTPLIPDFPIKLSDLDDMKIILHNIGDSLSIDHPGFQDKEYRKRRTMIAELCNNYKMLSPIPKIEYTQTEINTWRYLYNKLTTLNSTNAVSQFVIEFKKLEECGLFSESHIPQLDEINQYLISKSNWRIKPVSGILSQREYLNCLAFRVFPSTQYIRHHSQPLFTPEPDVVHEFIGHVANFCDPVFCDISQQLGLLSLGASDSLVQLIGSVYWFTIEFGACMEKDKMKYYGAGICGGLGEIENLINNPQMRLFDVDKAFPPLDIITDKVQPYYYYINSFEELLNQLRKLSPKLEKPFKYSMNKDSTELFIDRKIETYPENNKQDLFN